MEIKEIKGSTKVALIIEKEDLNSLFKRVGYMCAGKYKRAGVPDSDANKSYDFWNDLNDALNEVDG